MRSRLMFAGLGATSLMAFLASSGFVNAQPVTHAGARRPAISTPKLSYKGTITMYAEGYTPAVPGLKFPSGSAHLEAFAEAAKAFERLYPGIHIKFLTEPNLSTQWYEANAAAGTLPDVVWSLYQQNNSTFPKGIFTNLTPYFNQPNPYLAGKKSWKSVMNPTVLAMTAAPSGAQYQVVGDWVGTSFYYNVAMFRKAGIAKSPKTWAQLIADCKKLKAHGIVPGADIANYSWFSRLFLDNMLGLSSGI